MSIQAFAFRFEKEFKDLGPTPKKCILKYDCIIFKKTNPFGQINISTHLNALWLDETNILPLLERLFNELSSVCEPIYSRGELVANGVVCDAQPLKIDTRTVEDTLNYIITLEDGTNKQFTATLVHHKFYVNEEYDITNFYFESEVKEIKIDGKVITPDDLDEYFPLWQALKNSDMGKYSEEAYWFRENACELIEETFSHDVKRYILKDLPKYLPNSTTGKRKDTVAA